ncbi:MAG: VWA domain-containing protein [Deltaproteobacteria bacterium]|nr:VWA domain-containing protein [Deltaproteobacteria bacterium]
MKEGLASNLSIDFFEEDEIHDILIEIDSFGPGLKQKILALSYALSTASSSLVPNTLKRIKKASQQLPPDDMERWMTRAFDLLDSAGIGPFMDFIAIVDSGGLASFQRPEGLRLKDVAVLLETYVRGISGLELKIAPGKELFTDTETIYLPPIVDRYGDDAKRALLLYKIMASYKWAQISTGIFTPPDHPDIDSFFSPFDETELALDIYNILGAVSSEMLLSRELPGLMRETDIVKAEIFEQRPFLKDLPVKSVFVEGLFQYFLKGTTRGPAPGPLKALLDEYLPGMRLDVGHRMRVFQKMYDAASVLAGSYVHRPLPILGVIRPRQVSKTLRANRDAHRKRLEGIIRDIINRPEFEPAVKKPLSEAASSERIPRPEGEYLLIKGRLIELDSEMKNIIDEMGDAPGGVLVKGSDMGAARHCIVLKEDLLNEEEPGQASGEGIKYDEWDFRRGGYKKNWCSLYERDVYPGHDHYVSHVLRRYGGYVNILKKKFEMLKREPRTVRRQREGDDIDLDAVVEAYSDMKAGIHPGENFFMKLERHERNIAVLFLLDMSGSTKGWVNETERESLVLMCEALEALGDRYAIYGFSGMTRTKCDYYRIKSFEDAYSDIVKKRISGIGPKDYTRMGPPIRHSSFILKSIEARTKLLITISDGKPEDWDTYKGDYGIEDTRKALLEAREQGVHPFCITIDKEAGPYLRHMYGDVNYIVIDDVRKLPNRITEIYRRLTT